MSQQIIFFILAAITLTSAIAVVTMRNLFHAALALMVSFLGVAGIYVLLEAGFMGMAQLLVYIGAISILIIFAVMMTRRMMQTRETPFNAQTLAALVGTLITMAILFVVIGRLYPLAPTTEIPLGAAPQVDPAIIGSSIDQLGRAFVGANAYVLPFEVASVLLLAALVGSIIIAWPRSGEEDNL
ncbi:MAG TPA: NADH-quinone oxidoreductase subunit J [Promineifilum sp.]|nr:NADH-quinone oxidoreductase subunit J [Promineifilum sp.]HRO89750.1 NADH-quinone oxidoreductase subunit J [Promineifilum sp.]HRQ13343.1 NADH-quinone oxidoreductase subunit J [Promineifilum sp.]